MSKTVNNFAGLNGFVWWVGEIINRVDELGLSRYQVRIFGWYGDSIQDSDLPWAQAMLAPNASKTFEPMSIGSWVVGFFMDGESGQFPIIMGVLPGVSQVNTSIDPNSKTVSSSVSNPYTS